MKNRNFFKNFILSIFTLCAILCANTNVYGMKRSATWELPENPPAPSYSPSVNSSGNDDFLPNATESTGLILPIVSSDSNTLDLFLPTISVADTDFDATHSGNNSMLLPLPLTTATTTHIAATTTNSNSTLNSGPVAQNFNNPDNDDNDDVVQNNSNNQAAPTTTATTALTTTTTTSIASDEINKDADENFELEDELYQLLFGAENNQSSTTRPTLTNSNANLLPFMETPYSEPSAPTQMAPNQNSSSSTSSQSGTQRQFIHFTIKNNTNKNLNISIDSDRYTIAANSSREFPKERGDDFTISYTYKKTDFNEQFTDDEADNQIFAITEDGITLQQNEVQLYQSSSSSTTTYGKFGRIFEQQNNTNKTYTPKDIPENQLNEKLKDARMLTKQLRQKPNKETLKETIEILLGILNKTHTEKYGCRSSKQGSKYYLRLIQNRARLYLGQITESLRSNPSLNSNNSSTSALNSSSSSNNNISDNSSTEIDTATYNTNQPTTTTTSTSNTNTNNDKFTDEFDIYLFDNNDGKKGTNQNNNASSTSNNSDSTTSISSNITTGSQQQDLFYAEIKKQQSEGQRFIGYAKSIISQNENPKEIPTEAQEILQKAQEIYLNILKKLTNIKYSKKKNDIRTNTYRTLGYIIELKNGKSTYANIQPNKLNEWLIQAETLGKNNMDQKNYAAAQNIFLSILRNAVRSKALRARIQWALGLITEILSNNPNLNNNSSTSSTSSSSSSSTTANINNNATTTNYQQ